MAKCRTYVDACVLIAAFSAKHDLHREALAVLDDPERTFIVSDFLRLETLPKPFFQKKEEELEFMKLFFDSASEDILPSKNITEQALNLAGKYDVSHKDALQVGVAVCANVDEFITLERPEKPMFRVKEIKIVSLH